MFFVNGIDLTTSEFEELKALTAGEAVKKHECVSDEKVAIYKELHKVGLIEGTSTMYDFIFEGVTPAGKEWISDFTKQQDEAKRAVRADRKFQLITIALSIVASVITALLTTFLTRLFFP